MKVKDELAGRRIKCPHCGEITKAPALDEETAPVAAEPPRKAPVRPRDDEEDDRKPKREESPAKAKKKRAEPEQEVDAPKKKPSRKGLYLRIGAGVFLVLLGAVVAFSYWSANRLEKDSYGMKNIWAKGGNDRDPEKSAPKDEETKKEVEKESTIQIDAVELGKEFMSDPKAWERKYKDKTLEVTGEVGATAFFQQGKRANLGLKPLSSGPIAGKGIVLLASTESPTALEKCKVVKIGEKVKILATVGSVLGNEVELSMKGLQLLGNARAPEIRVADIVKEFAVNADAAEKKYKELGEVILVGTIDSVVEKYARKCLVLKGDGDQRVLLMMMLDDLKWLQGKEGTEVRARTEFRIVEASDPKQIEFGHACVLDVR